MPLQSVTVAVAVFGLIITICTLVFHAGRLSARVDILDKQFNKHVDTAATEMRELRGEVHRSIGEIRNELSDKAKEIVALLRATLANRREVAREPEA